MDSATATTTWPCHEDRDSNYNRQNADCEGPIKPELNSRLMRSETVSPAKLLWATSPKSRTTDRNRIRSATPTLDRSFATRLWTKRLGCSDMYSIRCLYLFVLVWRLPETLYHIKQGPVRQAERKRQQADNGVSSFVTTGPRMS